MNYKELFKKIKEIPCERVVQTFSKVKMSLSGNVFLCQCPFHNSADTGNFRIFTDSNRWQCFSCGEYGDNIDFVASLLHCSNGEAARQIAGAFGLEAGDFRAIPLREISCKKVETLPDERTHSIIRAITSKMTLEPWAVRYLLEDRKLPKGSLNDFFCFRQLSEAEENDIIKSLSLTERELNLCPLWYKRQGRWHVTIPCAKDNLGIKIRNAKNQVVGVQIRHCGKIPEGMPKYVWVSSAWAQVPTEQNKMACCGCGQVGRAACFVAGDDYSVSPPIKVILTEGVFKARALKDLQRGTNSKYPIVALQGVGSYKQGFAEIDTMRKAYAPNLSQFGIAFDADWVKNPGVLKAMLSAEEEARKRGLSVSFLLWREEYGKGVDDVIYAGNIGHIKAVEGNAFREIVKDYIPSKDVSEQEKILDRLCL